jgi:tRNA dimethylallyltransferase
MSKPKVIAIVGPTASGKTGLSIDIAERFSGEVISADSRQVYRGLDIGSGKVTEAEMRGIPHHLIDIAPLDTIYTATDFKRDATDAITAILDRQHLPIIAGGTFFYLDQLRGTAASAPVAPNDALRSSLELRTTEELYEELLSKDKERAESIDPYNRRRLIRALEIVATLGTVPQAPVTESPYEWLMIGLEWPKEALYARIHERLLARLEQGMVAEVQGLLEQGVTHERLQGLGLEYRYVSEHLAGALTYDDMVTTLEIKIRQFAKRQLTWLKRDATIEWFSPRDHDSIMSRVDTFLKTS